MAKFYRVTLTAEERGHLEDLLRVGKTQPRFQNYARILLHCDESPAGPALDDLSVTEIAGVSVRTVERVRERFVEEGFEAALKPRPVKRVYQRLLDGRQEAQLIKIACSSPPEGKKRWSLQMLADEMVRLEHAPTLSYETVRRTLKKTRSSRT